MFPLLAIALLTCGNERWDVKTLTDKDASKVALKAIHPMPNIDALRILKEPYTAWGNSMPRTTAETGVYEVEADVTAFKVEDDGDVHIVLAKPGNHEDTMIAEIPAPECLKTSLVKTEATQSRISFQRIFGTLPKTVGKLHYPKTPIRVRIAGVLFFDKLHGQTGVAPNGVELHPVLNIERVSQNSTPSP
jgi:hypothetical protein